MEQSYALIMRNVFRDSKPPPSVILKRVKDDKVLNNNGSRGDAEARRSSNTLRHLRTLREPKIISRRVCRDTQSLRIYSLRASASPRESLSALRAGANA